jgi:hypothetical protein
MLGVLQFESQLARFSLRRWSDAMANPRAERVRYRDEHEVLTVLRGLLDGHSVRALRGFLVELGAPVTSLSDQPLELLWLLARHIVSGELVLEREPIVPMPSERIEKTERVHVEPLRQNQIADGPGLHVVSLAQARQVNEQKLLEHQAKQAQSLRTAAVVGAPFCEVCAGLAERKSADSIIVSEPTLTTQAKQAETLRTAAVSGSGFCEVCANCHAKLTPSAVPTTVSDPPPTVLASQANQAESLRSASVGGKPFCAHCNC